MGTVEIVLRTAALLGCLVLAAVLLVLRRRDHTPYLGALYCLGAIAFVATSSAGAGRMLGPWLYPLTFLCVIKAAWFWLFARGLFAGDFRINAAHLFLVASVGAYGTWQQLVVAPAAASGSVGGIARGASLGFELVVLALVLLALAEAYRGLSTDLFERRRRLRIVFVAAVGAYLAAAAGVQAYNLLLEVRTPPAIVWANLGLIFLTSTAIALSLVRLKPANWLEDTPHSSSADIGPEGQRLLAALEHAMEHQRTYREEGLTIGQLADRLGTREQVLRRVINGGLGFRNFNDFLHAYRIREASARLRRSSDSDIPVLSIALDVGYGSIGPFNRAFKARTGMTPSAFRRRARGSREPA